MAAGMNLARQVFNNCHARTFRVSPKAPLAEVTVLDAMNCAGYQGVSYWQHRIPQQRRQGRWWSPTATMRSSRYTERILIGGLPNRKTTYCFDLFCPKPHPQTPGRIQWGVDSKILFFHNRSIFNPELGAPLFGSSQGSGSLSALIYIEGPSTQYFRFLPAKAIKGTLFLEPDACNIGNVDPLLECC